MAGLYLHIPFCKQACSYCDFYFITQQKHKKSFVEALIREIKSKKDTIYAREQIKTIYFGGGTPSLLSLTQVNDIMEAIYEVFDIDATEITFELNPDNVTEEYLRGLKQAGINRVSMGVQTFNKDLLKFMNRAHSAEEAVLCMDLLKESGIDVYTVDIIYGNPGQTLEMLDKDLDKLVDYDPPHVSAYALTIEPRTRLWKQVELGRILPADEYDVAAHFKLVENRLAEIGLNRYEVSSFSKPDYEARHNSAYWTHENYLGLGPGAHSFWWDKSKKNGYRWENKKDFMNYINPTQNISTDQENLSLFALAEERIMLGLRTKWGVGLDELKNRYDFEFSASQINYLKGKEQEGKLTFNDKIALSTEGLRIADAIILDILTV